MIIVFQSFLVFCQWIMCAYWPN